MIIVIINGQPAVGKLTTAKILANLTEFKLFHHHLTCDLSKELFPYGSKGYFELNDILRIESFKLFARYKMEGVLFPFCFCARDYYDFMLRLKQTATDKEISLIQVYLTCSIKEQHRRVLQPDRKKYTKATTIEELESYKKRKKYSVITGVPTLRIDNTHIKPDLVADMIDSHFELSKKPISGAQRG
jgi:cytidylate kinase